MSEVATLASMVFIARHQQIMAHKLIVFGVRVRVRVSRVLRQSSLLAINITPCLTCDKRKLIWTSTYNRSITVMKVLDHEWQTSRHLVVEVR